ncbi:MAG: peptidase T, partial [Cetobacterium sp.]
MSFLLEKFLEYVKIDTTADSKSKTCPSTDIQWDLAKIIVKDLEEIGLMDITLDENGYIMATLKSNSKKDIPTIGFIAHMDTAPSFNGTNVKPRIIENYNGTDIVLNKELNIVMHTKDFP